jgi:hypothetical protein
MVHIGHKVDHTLIADLMVLFETVMQNFACLTCQALQVGQGGCMGEAVGLQN